MTCCGKLVCHVPEKVANRNAEFHIASCTRITNRGLKQPFKSLRLGNGDSQTVRNSGKPAHHNVITQV